MSIMDFFRATPTQPGTPAAPANQPVAGTPGPGQIPATPTGTTPAPGTGDVPANSGATPVATGGDKSPMDQFATLWQNATTGSGNAKEPLFKLDPTKLLEAAKTIPFSQAVTPEQLAAIAKGGDEAQKAFADAMQSVAATTMMHSAVTTGNMVQTAMDKARTDWMKEVPGLIRSQNVRETVLTENPALSHPSTQPFVNLLQSQLQVKHPNATAAELRSMMSQYFDGLAGVIKPQAAPKDQAAASGGNDWSNFLE